MAEWQLIETAPKDGTLILVAPSIYSDRPCDMARWDDDRFNKKPRPFWRRAGSSYVAQDRSTAPTHWQPLPVLSVS